MKRILTFVILTLSGVFLNSCANDFAYGYKYDFTPRARVQGVLLSGIEGVAADFGFSYVPPVINEMKYKDSTLFVRVERRDATEYCDHLGGASILVFPAQGRIVLSVPGIAERNDSLERLAERIGKVLDSVIGERNWKREDVSGTTVFNLA
jgi:hypothetical protein